MIEILTIFFFPWLMAYIAASDLFTMTITNRVCLILIAGFFFMAILTGMDISLVGWHALTGLTVLLVTFTLFALNCMGGGDAKMVAATSLWFGFSLTLYFITMAAIIGGVLTIVILLLRSDRLVYYYPDWAWLKRISSHKSGIPYGIALALGAMMAYSKSPWMQLIS